MYIRTFNSLPAILCCTLKKVRSASGILCATRRGPMQPPPSIATLRARRAATHAPNAPRPSLSHVSFERGPPKRAPMPPPFCHPSQGANSQHPPNAQQGRMYPAQPPWHPNSPQPLSFERPNRRALPANPHHLRTIQSLPCTQPQLRPAQAVHETPLRTPPEQSRSNPQDTPSTHHVATLCTHPALKLRENEVRLRTCTQHMHPVQPLALRGLARCGI